MNILPGDTSYNILLMIAVCGEYPYYSLSLADGNHKWILKVVRDLVAEKYIHVTGNGQLKKIRLLKKGLEVLAPYERAQYELMCAGQKLRSDKKHVSRDLRAAEVMQMFRRSNVAVAYYEKPLLNPTKYSDPYQTLPAGRIPSLPDAPDEKYIGLPCFYTSRELKQTNPNGIKKTEFTRMHGSYVTSNNYYCVYNLNNRQIKWTSEWEIKSECMLNEIERTNGWEHGPEDSHRFSAIFFVKNTDLLLNILNNDDHRSKYLQIDNKFAVAHYVPLNENGVEVLRLLSIPNYQEKSLNSLFNEETFTIRNKNSAICVDAIDNNGYTYTLWFDGDLERLKLLNDAIRIEELDASKLIIYCFDWQVEFLNEYLPKGVIIKILSINFGDKPKTGGN